MGELHHTQVVKENGSEPSSPQTPNGGISSAAGYRVRSSRLLKVINWWHCAMVYFPMVQRFLIVVLVSQLVHDGWIHKQEYKEMGVMMESMKVVLASLFWKVTPLLILALWWVSQKTQAVYLVDFATFKAPSDWRVSHAQVMEILKRQKCFTQTSLDFMERVLANSGTGPSTAWPPGTVKCLQSEDVEADRTEEAARAESETVIISAVKDLLARTKVKPKQIDILIINCSLFSPTPSMCAMVAHHFQMRSDVLTFNLSGMGCSAGLVSIDLAQRLLEQRPRSMALVVSTENLTQALYHGNDRAFLLQNTLFRCGGSAVLLSNKREDGLHAKFKLLHVVRTQGTDVHSYDAVYSTQDDTGHQGVRLSKDIVKVAGRLMEKNLTTMGPRILPVSELSKVVWSLMLRTISNSVRRLAKTSGLIGLAQSIPEVRPYVPDFKRAVDHFCIHAGGRGVIDGIEKNLNLLPYHVEPSRMTLYDYGNTSSSSIWYELEYIENHMNLRKGQRVLQIAFGSGFKANSAVWVSLRTPPKAR